MKTILAFTIILIFSISYAATPDPTPVEPQLNVGVKTVAATNRTNTTNIADCGNLSTPDTKYVLINNVSAAGVCFDISASNITLDLNGKTITYGTGSCSGKDLCAAGVTISGYSITNIQIVNGTISEGTGNNLPRYAQSGYGINPFFERVGPSNVELGGLIINYHADEMSGIYAIYTSGLSVHDCTITDNGNVVANRHISKSAIQNGLGSGAKIYNNRIINYRQVGISPAKSSIIHDNDLSGMSVNTNSFGISSAGDSDNGCSGYGYSSIYGNKIIGRGVHPIGIWVGCYDHIYNNYIDVKSDATIIPEYSGAMGIRSTWAHHNADIHGNTIIATTAQGHVARGIMIGSYIPNDSINIYENLIVATSDDGVTKAVALSFEANGSDTQEGSANIKVIRNTIKSNLWMVLSGGSYGPTKGYPALSGNRFIKFGDFQGYKTFHDEGYNVVSTLSLYNNSYEGGAGPSDIHFLSNATALKDIIIHNNELVTTPKGLKILK